MQVRLGRLLWAASRRDEESLRRELESARAEVMGPFSAAAMESYSRAYPHLVKLHMLQEVADIAGGWLRFPAAFFCACSGWGLHGWLRLVKLRSAVLVSSCLRWRIYQVGQEGIRHNDLGPFAGRTPPKTSRLWSGMLKTAFNNPVWPDLPAGLLHKPMGPHDRQRALRWDERLAVTQSSLATQVSSCQD